MSMPPNHFRYVPTASRRICLDTFSQRILVSSPMREEHWAIRRRLLEYAPFLEIGREGRINSCREGETYGTYFLPYPQVVCLESKNEGIQHDHHKTGPFIHLLSVDGWKHVVKKEERFPEALCLDLDLRA